jgi:hypothetical protein
MNRCAEIDADRAQHQRRGDTASIENAARRNHGYRDTASTTFGTSAIVLTSPQ